MLEGAIAHFECGYSTWAYFIAGDEDSVRGLAVGEIKRFWSETYRPANTVVAVVIMFSAFFAELVAPHDPFNLATVDLFNALLPPAWGDGGQPEFLLGTDDQGRDILSTMIYGARISLGVGFASVVLAMFLGVGLGLVSGYLGGTVDAVIMRLVDMVISFPQLVLLITIIALFQPSIFLITAVLGLTLCAGLINIVYKGAGESLTEVGRETDPQRRKHVVGQ